MSSSVPGMLRKRVVLSILRTEEEVAKNLGDLEVCEKIILKKAMGKNKAKGQKQKNVFHVANKNIMKTKSKSKPVTTSLKKINIVNEEKVNQINKVFTEVQKEVKLLSKAAASDLPKKHLIPKPPEREPVHVDAATNLLSQL